MRRVLLGTCSIFVLATATTGHTQSSTETYTYDALEGL